MSNTATIDWWDRSIAEIGPRAMDHHLSGDSDWNAVLLSGRQDVERAIKVTQMQVGRDRTIVELGCGMGRLCFALAEQFGFVLGVDVSSSLLAHARRHNHLGNVAFEQGDGSRFAPRIVETCDTVFSFEVLHYVDRTTFANYLRDAFAVLKPGGQLVLEWNSEENGMATKLAGVIRRIMYVCGKTEWRGWPNGAGFRRVRHPVQSTVSLLTELGFRVDRTIADNPKQVWIVARKPDWQ